MNLCKKWGKAKVATYLFLALAAVSQAPKWAWSAESKEHRHGEVSTDTVNDSLCHLPRGKGPKAEKLQGQSKGLQNKGAGKDGQKTIDN